MRVNVRAAMDALFAGKDCHKSHSVYTDQTGAKCPECSDWHPTVFSYGRHFPLVILVDGVCAYVNPRKYSVTTSVQQGSARYYLHTKGFVDTGNMVDGYEVWTKES